MKPNILVPVDLSEVSERTFPFAADLACRFAATVKLMHVLPRLPDLAGKEAASLTTYERVVMDQAEIELQQLAKLEVFEDVEVETDLSLEKSPGPAVVGKAESETPLMVVLSSHGWRGPARLLLGSVAEEILRTCPAPVLTVREEGPLWSDGQVILVAIDFSAASLYTVEAAARLSRLLGLKVHLVHVFEPRVSPLLAEALPEAKEPPRDDQRAAAMEKLVQLAKGAGLGDRFQAATVFGGPKERVLHLAKALKPALIVVGSHGRRGLGRVVLGSVAEGIVRESKCPTLVVKDGGFLENWPANVPEHCRAES